MWLNSNKGTKCDIEIYDSRALFRGFKCAASECWTRQHPYPLACLHLYLCRRSWKRSKIPLNGRHSSILDAVAHGSAAAWRHFNLLVEYDFSEEKLRDGMGIRLPKLMN